MSNHLDLTITGSPIASSAVRKRLRQVLTEDWNLSFTVPIEELLIAVGESVTNAFRHGCDSLPRPIKVNATYDPSSSSITVEISDTGKGFDINQPFRVEPFKDLCCCGRYIMSQAADIVEYLRRDGWFVCRLIKRI